MYSHSGRSDDSFLKHGARISLHFGRLQKTLEFIKHTLAAIQASCNITSCTCDQAMVEHISADAM
jgi:hypothetical protein